MSRRSSSPPDLSGFQRPTDEPTDFADDPPVPAPDYNPFAALALDPTTGIDITAEDVRRARGRATRHRHEATTNRFPHTASAFPSMAQVNASHDYLLDTPRNIRSATRRWRGRHHNVFFPEYPLGDPRVFQPAAATPTPSPTATPRSGPSATARPNAPSGGYQPHPAGCRCYTCTMGRNANGEAAPSGPHPFRCHCPQCNFPGNARPSSGTRSSARPAASGTAGSGFSPSSGTGDDPIELSSGSDDTGGGEADDDNEPIVIDTDDESYRDDDEEDEPLPSLSREPRPYGGNMSSAPRARGRGRGSGVHRGGGGRSTSARNTPIANPITNDRIIVGTWRHATGNPANAVTAGFDNRGRIFYRITNRTLAGNTIAAPNATATNFRDIILRGPYRNMLPDHLRSVIDQHLRLPPNQRP